MNLQEWKDSNKSLNSFINCDNMEFMKEIPDKFFELAIVDPPYFEDYGKEIYPGAAISTTGIKRNRYNSKFWDLPDDRYLNNLLRISRNQIIWGWNYFDLKYLGSGRIIWDKENDSSSFSKCEIAYCSFHKRTEIFRYMWNGMIQKNMKEKQVRIHPTQKPIQLYRWLLQNYAKPGDKVFDSHVGSASSLIACHLEGFEYIGCELDPDYYKAANERLEQYKMQQSLFGNIFLTQ